MNRKERTKGGREGFSVPALTGLGLGLKLTFLVLAAVAGVTALTSWFSIKQLRSSLTAGMEETADGLGRVVGLASAYQGFFESDYRRLNQYIDSAASLPDVEYAAVLDRDGKIIAARGLNRDEQISLEETGKISVSPQVYEARQDIELDRPVGKIGTIIIGISKARIIAEEDRIVGTHLKVAGVISLGALAILWLVVYSITHPLRLLAEQTHRMGEGNLIEPVAVRGGGDEVGVLAGGIEFMRASLYRNIQELEFLGKISHFLNESRDLGEIVGILRQQIENYPIRPWRVAGIGLVGRDIPPGSFRYIPILPPAPDPTGEIYELGGVIQEALEMKSGRARGAASRRQDSPFDAWGQEQGLESELALPMVSRGNFLGVFYLGFGDPDTAYSQELQTLARDVANDLTAAVDNCFLVSDLKFNLEQLKIAHRELKSLDNVKTEFISGVSHELRTPLVAISGYVHMMLEEKLGPLTEMQKEGLDISAKSLQRLTVLIDKILSFSSHITAADLRLAPKNIADIIDHCYKMEKSRAEDKKIGLRVAVEPNLPPVLVDEDLIIQVFINLIDNALKFSRENTIIEIRARRPFKETPERQDRVEVLIRDQGRGIEEKDLRNIFIKFYQVSRSAEGQRYAGIGLGLSLVKKIIEQHGGIIEVESVVDKGTTFVFTLPTVTAAKPGPDQD